MPVLAVPGGWAGSREGDLLVPTWDFRVKAAKGAVRPNQPWSCPLQLLSVATGDRPGGARWRGKGGTYGKFSADIQMRMSVSTPFAVCFGNLDLPSDSEAVTISSEGRTSRMHGSRPHESNGSGEHRAGHRALARNRQEAWRPRSGAPKCERATRLALDQ